VVQANDYYSYNRGDLPKGCQMCVKGEKLVLFVTGACPRKCYFCPVSDQKFGVDVSYANEKKVFSSKDVIAEAKLMSAKGAGITGGDPLAKIDRTVRYIKKLKEEFGPSFHIHLYTSLNLASESNLQKLFQAGLDEIRFHLDFESKQFYKNILRASKFPWSIGIEVPSIPGKEKVLKKIIDYIHDKVEFLNLNELEIADNELSKLGEMGFKTKSKFSYAIDGSLKCGFDAIKYVEDKGYNLKVHLCTAKLKDGVQLANRLINESKGAKKKFDLVDDEGMLIRGAVYLKELAPGFSYRETLEKVDRESVLLKLNPIFDKIKSKLKLDDDDIFLDEKKLRVLIAKKNLKKLKTKEVAKGLMLAIVTEYPTDDQLEMEVEFI
jgi:hypothetical protein